MLKGIRHVMKDKDDSEGHLTSPSAVPPRVRGGVEMSIHGDGDTCGGGARVESKSDRQAVKDDLLIPCAYSRLCYPAPTAAHFPIVVKYSIHRSGGRITGLLETLDVCRELRVTHARPSEALRPPTMASLEEELTCSVCRDFFSRGRPLPCGHSFCPACVREAWGGGGGGEGRRRFACPQCEEEGGEVPCDCCPPAADDGRPPPAVKTCLSISDDLRSATRVKSRLPCALHPERFDHWPQVLAAQAFTCGTHYWELEAEGFWDIGVCYRSIGRKGKEGNAFGNNEVSWSLTQQHDRKLAAWHNRRKTRLARQMSGNRVAVAVDYGAGTATFSEVGPSNHLTHLHTFSATFTQPLCLGFGLYKAELNSHICIV
ncbi:Stonustoxin subunit beta [Liparis tanakae]|uniref:Stonustoxin subunit beta n=1 Tax=Liparis tanakae TaxID=230148 RepID=A0A4Z2GK40_9TELE|nr:Stonustoxin subunit beta [Liparis tanakae]